MADAESSFYFRVRKPKLVDFEFKISLHQDDMPALLYIQKTLGIGKVDTSGTMSSYRVRTQKELQVLIKIFDKFTLNSSKYLNYLVFKQAFELYITSKTKSDSLIQTIQNLKDGGVNRTRTCHILPEEHKLRLTPS